LASWLGVKTAFIEKAGPRGNEYNESFNRKPPDGLLNGEIFDTLKEANIPIERGRRCNRAIRPHGTFGYRPATWVAVITALAAQGSAIEGFCPAGPRAENDVRLE